MFSWERDVKESEVLSRFAWQEDSHYLVPSVDLAAIEALSGQGGHCGNAPWTSIEDCRTQSGFNTYVLSRSCIPNRL